MELDEVDEELECLMEEGEEEVECNARNSYLSTYRRQRRHQGHDIRVMTLTLTRWGRNVVKKWRYGVE